MTGRENIFLQGAVMGMSREHIRRRMDDIIDFSGISEFMDTPVKRFSSGMNARLGFSIAAHLDPDVLIIDEVLAVGDAAFQSRAYGRIRDLVSSGIPVLIVSHQLDKVAELCRSAILLDHGKVVLHSTPEDCIAHYLQPTDGSGDAPRSKAILSLGFPEGNRVQSGERVRLCATISADHREQGSVEPLAFMVRNSRTGAVLSAVGTEMCLVSLPPGQATIEASLQMNVPPGVYAVETIVYDLKASRVVEQGPSGMIVVEQGGEFRGQVQLNARMKLADDVSIEPAGRG